LKDFAKLRQECASCPFDAYQFTLDGYHACTAHRPPVPIPEDTLALVEHKESVRCKEFRHGVLYGDNREKGEVVGFVENRCDKKGIRFEVLQLPTGYGDYYFEFIDEEKRLLTAGFERKTFEDFYHSVINGNLTIQVQSLVDNVDFPFLLLSGSLDVVDFTHYELVLATIGAMAAEYGLTIVSNMTDSQLATVLVATIENLHLNRHRIGIRARRKEIDMRVQFLMNAFEGVGLKTANLMLEKMGSVSGVLRTLQRDPREFAKKIRVISEKRAQEFYNIVTSEEIVEHPEKKSPSKAALRRSYRRRGQPGEK
jgi:ERCC4-type nuclease